MAAADINASEPRKVKVIAYYLHISKTGRTCTGLVRRDTVDFVTGEVLDTGRRYVALKKRALKRGWTLVKESGS